MTSRTNVRSACGFSGVFFNLSHGLVGVFEMELSQMGKNNGNPYLVCKNTLSHLQKSEIQPTYKTRKVFKKRYSAAFQFIKL